MTTTATTQPDPVHAQRLAAGRACLEAALQVYLPQGLSVTCCCDPDHIGVGTKHGKQCTSPGKAPMHAWKKRQETLPTEADVTTAWRDYPLGNVGCVLGQVSGLVRVDVDGAPGDAALHEWSHGDLPPTWEFGSSTAGRGLLYRWDQALPCHTVIKPSPDGEHTELRLMGNGSQTVLPPSRHASGSLYVWVPGHGPDDLPLAPAPAWLAARMTEEARPAARPTRPTDAPDSAYAAELLGYVPNPGADRDTWRDMGMALHSTGADWAFELWDAWSQQYPEKYDAGDQARTWNSFSLEGPAGKAPITFGTLVHLAKVGGYQQRNGDTPGPPGKEPPLPLSDYTNALAFVRDHGQNLRYLEAWGKWLHWTGTHWCYEVQGPIMQKAKATVRGLLRRAADFDGKELAAWMTHIKTSLSVGKLKAMVETAQDEPDVVIRLGALNTHPWLLPCPNGTIDLKTGIRQEPNRNDFLTECLHVPYDLAATCPTWEAFLWTIMGGRPPLSDDADGLHGEELEAYTAAQARAHLFCGFLQRVLGQCLTGDVSEQDLYIFYGTGANGKSTLLNTILALLGAYAMKGTAELLMTTRNDRHPTERADLYGKRLVATIETQEAGRLNETFIKEATGGDPIRARRMREDFWEFLPSHTMILATNHKPEIRGTDYAIWRRIKLIPFTVVIADDQQDKSLPELLLKELPGILAWMVRGCLDWRENGLRPPPEVLLATEAYKQEQDVFEAFLATECFRIPTARVSAADLYSAYERWCKENDIEPIKKRAFGIRLGDSGCRPDQGTGGRREWVGIGLPAQTSEEGRYGT